MLALAQLALLLLHPVPGLAADSCQCSMARIPGGRTVIGTGAQLPEEQPADNLAIRSFCLDRTHLTC